jgi:hypothetical protein
VLLCAAPECHEDVSIPLPAVDARKTRAGTPVLLVSLLLSPCYTGFEVSPACVAECSLGPKVAAYQAKLDAAKGDSVWTLTWL